ncbi:hypothetical protein DFH27DRAFT_590686 [Peziza echinospora]|nr:hypothetical protein DFH27DRAFT_590686 [Peziza echinospora]
MTELEKFLQMIADPYQDSFNQNSIVASVGSSLGTTALIFLAWCMIRPHNTIVYAPKLRHRDNSHTQQPPRIESGIFGWVKPLWNAKEDDLVEQIGLDAVLFLRVLKMCRTILGALGLLGIVVVIPCNILLSVKELQSKKDAVVKVTPVVLLGPGMWVHVVMAWVFDAIIIYILWVNYKAVAILRQKYFESHEYQVALSSRTLMVTDIPSNYRSNDGLEQIIRGATPPSASDKNHAIGRAVKDLPDLIEQHNEAVYDLEAVLAKYLYDPANLPASRPVCTPKRGDKSMPKGMQVDAIDYLYQRVDELERRIQRVRDTVDSRDAEHYGFVSYMSISEAHSAALAAKGKREHGTTIQLAPKPNDLIWENLRRTKQQRRWNAIMGNILFTLLSIGFIVPNAFIAVFLSDISRIAEFWPAFKANFYRNPKQWAFVQGFIAPVVTSIIYLILPIVMRRLSKWQGDLKKTSRERHVTAKLYAFFMFNNLIVFTIFSTIWQLVFVMIKEGENNGKGRNPDIWKAIVEYKVATKITVSVFKVAPFWMMYLLQRNMGAVLDLAQIVSLLWGSFARKLLCPTPRQIIQHTAPPTFEFATYYNYFLFYFSIALVFATLQPLMLPIAFLYFLVDSWLKKYLLMYVFVTKVESGGGFWRMLFNRFIFAAMLSNIVIAVVVWVQFTDSYAWACVIPLLFILLGFKFYCARKFDTQFHYHITASDGEAIIGAAPDNGPGSGQRNAKLRTRFGHPALYKPLIQPMVHSKAQSILEQLYKGQLAKDSAVHQNTYGEIILDSMQEGRVGKKSGSGEKGGIGGQVQFVEENEMDFSQWKDRPEFNEEHVESMSQRGTEGQEYVGVPGYASPATSRAPSPSPAPLGGPPGSSGSAGAVGPTLPLLMAHHHQHQHPPMRASPLHRAATPSSLLDPNDHHHDARSIRSVGSSAPPGAWDDDSNALLDHDQQREYFNHAQQQGRSRSTSPVPPMPPIPKGGGLTYAEYRKGGR